MYFWQMRMAIIAHDGKKPEMVAFLLEHKAILEKIDLIATGTTGMHVRNAGLEVTMVKSGPKGGDAQIAGKIVNGEIDVVIFFRDPLGKHPHEPDVQMLLRICDLYNIPLATNPSTANMFFKVYEAGLS